MKENTLSGIGATFLELKEQYRDIKTFVFGRLDEVQAAVRNESFPILFLEVPTLRVEDNGSGYTNGRRLAAFGVIVRRKGLDEGLVNKAYFSATSLAGGLVADALTQDPTSSQAKYGERDTIEAYEKAEEICLDLLLLLLQKAKDSRGGWKITGPFDLEPVQALSSGDDVGFRVEFTVEKAIPRCVDQSKLIS